MPASPRATDPRFAAAEARFHAAASNLERASLDRIDRSTGGQPNYGSEERVGAIVAERIEHLTDEVIAKIRERQSY